MGYITRMRYVARSLILTEKAAPASLNKTLMHALVNAADSDCKADADCGSRAGFRAALQPRPLGYFPRDVFFFGFGFAAPLPLSAACCFFFLAGISTSHWKNAPAPCDS